MTKWTNTPFKSIQEAHDTANSYDLNPTEISPSEDGRFNSFIVYEGRDTVYIAQALIGGPVREKTVGSRRRVRDPRIPVFREEDRLLAGPWIASDFVTFDDVREHWRTQFINPDDVEVLQIVLYRIDEFEYEYVIDGGRVRQRVLHKRK